MAARTGFVPTHVRSGSARSRFAAALSRCFQVLDTPGHRAAASRAGALVDEGSVQNTNSWGLRGAEPDPSAAVRGIVLGDSFMQGMFNGDGDTPPLDLERYLQAAWKVPVSILNTGHIGYSPEQYYYALREYGDRFRPQFVVVSVCPNDFGDGPAVLLGEGDWYKESEFWLDEIQLWCNSRSVLALVVAVPTHIQVESIRRDALYPGQVCSIVHANSARYCYPLDEFIDEHLRLAALPEVSGQLPLFSKLYNRPIHDDHFSPRGAALWAQIIGRRLVRILALRTAHSGEGVPGSLNPGAGPSGRELP
ncbi:MAG TPA: SGNH/GDSL hydrolase family protein [Isosphaeraceae bacterium]|nr:SGNH/GDSL hydrolase family protein [Isosphaeraceae bacterium]